MQRRTGYVILSSQRLIEAKPLPVETPSQKVELAALVCALRLAEGKSIHMHTDSKYTYRTQPSGLNKAFYQPRAAQSSMDSLSIMVLEVLCLPALAGMIHCRSYQHDTSSITQANNKAN